MIGDRYQLIEEIGSGGMATVWKANDALLGRSVAIKRLLPHLARDPGAAQRFKREAQAAAGLSHPGIVTVFDTGEDNEGPFIVLELIEGQTLAARVAALGALSPTEVVDIMFQAGSALDHAHSLGVVHRDVKPANLILDPEGRVRLTDFGIARTVADPTTITGAGELVGTIAYMAPEILQGAPATPASDIYSLAAVAHELLAGRPPFVAETPAAMLEAVRSNQPSDLRGLIPVDMATAVALGMSKEPKQRPASAGELAMALTGTATLVLGPHVLSPTPPPPASRVGSEEPTVVGGPPPHVDPEPVASDRTRSRWPVLALALALVGLSVAALTNDRSPGEPDGQGEGLLAAETTTTAPSTTTTSLPITTTTPPPTTTIPLDTPENVAAEIETLLATLQPPDFKRNDVRQIEDRLDQVMELWEDGDQDDLRRELERAFEAVSELEESPERDQLNELFTQLAEQMGFEVDQPPQDGDGDG